MLESSTKLTVINDDGTTTEYRLEFSYGQGWQYKKVIKPQGEAADYNPADTILYI